jgi:hypothetical protein
MISTFQKINELFEEINALLSKPIKIYIIGGAALLHFQLKPSTKDVDLIVKSKDDFNELKRVLVSVGFTSKQLTNQYKHLALDNQLVKGDFLLDIFASKVCGKLSLTDAMILRSIEYKKYGNLEVYFCSVEDILIFKTITDRDGDIDDCIAIAKREINWDLILAEILDQIKISKEEIWVTLFNERLLLLESKGVNIPILKKIEQLTDDWYTTNSVPLVDTKLSDLEDVRELMEQELDRDILSKKLYFSTFMPEDKKGNYIELCRVQFKTGSELTINKEVSSLLTIARSANGRKRPVDAHITFGEGEFNRYYMRAVCLLAQNIGKKVLAYRYKKPLQARSSSEAIIGKVFEPQEVLNELRLIPGSPTKFGLGEPNSGISLKLE